MIEAFEIGVSLALRDGVSDGLAKAQRDVRALETAVRGGGLSVQSLRDAAARALGAPVSSRLTPVEHKPLPPGAGEAHAAVEAGQAVRQQPPTVIDSRLPPMVGTATAPLADGTDFLVMDQPPPVLRESPPEAPSVVSAPPAAIDAPVFVQQSFGNDSRAAKTEELPRAMRPVAPAQVVTGLAAGLPQAAPPLPSIDWTLPALPSSPWDTPSSTPGSAENPAVHSLPGVHEPGLSLGGLLAGREAARPEAAWAGSSGQASAPPPAQKRDSGPHEGDVFLDGTLVGRWMSRHLNREAERASVGPTGFDARRSRLLPGATVGG